MTRKQFIAAKRAFRKATYPVTAEIEKQVEVCRVWFEHLTFNWKNFSNVKDQFVADLAKLQSMIAAAQTGR